MKQYNKPKVQGNNAWTQYNTLKERCKGVNTGSNEKI